ENNRSEETRSANRYPKHIKYCNGTPRQDHEDLTKRTDWLFELVFDYGEHDRDNPAPGDHGEWLCPNDSFSIYLAGFEIRAYRLCQRVLLFHHFPDEAGIGRDCLVRSTEVFYRNSRNEPEDSRRGNPNGSFIAEIVQSGYRRRMDGYLKR